MVCSTRRFVLCLTQCHFVLVIFSPFNITITSLGEERTTLSAFRTFVRYVLVWICRFPLPLGVWEGLRFVIVALPGRFSYLLFFFFTIDSASSGPTGCTFIPLLYMSSPIPSCTTPPVQRIYGLMNLHKDLTLSWAK